MNSYKPEDPRKPCWVWEAPAEGLSEQGVFFRGEYRGHVIPLEPEEHNLVAAPGCKLDGLVFRWLAWRLDGEVTTKGTGTLAALTRDEAVAAVEAWVDHSIEAEQL